MKLNYASLTNENENYEKYSNVPVVIENYEEDNIIEGLEGNKCPENHGYNRSENTCVECKSGEIVQEYTKVNNKLQRTLPTCVDAGFDCAQRMVVPLGVKKWIEECKDVKYSKQYKIENKLLNITDEWENLNKLPDLDKTKGDYSKIKEKYEGRFGKIDEIESFEDKIIEGYGMSGAISRALVSNIDSITQIRVKEQQEAESQGITLEQFRIEANINSLFTDIENAEKEIEKCNTEWQDKDRITDYEQVNKGLPNVAQNANSLIEKKGNAELMDKSYVLNQETMECEPTGESIYNCYGDTSMIYDQFSKECVSKEKGTNWEPPALPEGVCGNVTSSDEPEKAEEDDIPFWKKDPEVSVKEAEGCRQRGDEQCSTRLKEEKYPNYGGSDWTQINEQAYLLDNIKCNTCVTAIGNSGNIPCDTDCGYYIDKDILSSTCGQCILKEEVKNARDNNLKDKHGCASYYGPKCNLGTYYCAKQAAETGMKCSKAADLDSSKCSMQEFKSEFKIMNISSNELNLVRDQTRRNIINGYGGDYYFKKYVMNQGILDDFSKIDKAILEVQNIWRKIDNGVIDPFSVKKQTFTVLENGNPFIFEENSDEIKNRVIETTTVGNDQFKRGTYNLDEYHNYLNNLLFWGIKKRILYDTVNGEDKDKFKEAFAEVDSLTNVTDEDIYASIICRPSELGAAIINKYKNFHQEYDKVMSSTGGFGISKPVTEYLTSGTNPKKITCFDSVCKTDNKFKILDISLLDLTIGGTEFSINLNYQNQKYGLEKYKDNNDAIPTFSVKEIWKKVDCNEVNVFNIKKQKFNDTLDLLNGNISEADSINLDYYNMKMNDLLFWGLKKRVLYEMSQDDKIKEKFPVLHDRKNYEEIYKNIICEETELDNEIASKYKDFEKEKTKSLINTGGKGESKISENLFDYGICKNEDTSGEFVSDKILKDGDIFILKILYGSNEGYLAYNTTDESTDFELLQNYNNNEKNTVTLVYDGAVKGGRKYDKSNEYLSFDGKIEDTTQKFELEGIYSNDGTIDYREELILVNDQNESYKSQIYSNDFVIDNANMFFELAKNIRGLSKMIDGIQLVNPYANDRESISDVFNLLDFNKDGNLNVDEYKLHKICNDMYNNQPEIELSSLSSADMKSEMQDGLGYPVQKKTWIEYYIKNFGLNESVSNVYDKYSEYLIKIDPEKFKVSLTDYLNIADIDEDSVLNEFEAKLLVSMTSNYVTSKGDISVIDDFEIEDIKNKSIEELKSNTDLTFNDMHKNSLEKFKEDLIKTIKEKNPAPKINWMSIFDLFDTDNDGKLNADEAKICLAVTLDKELSDIKNITSEDNENTYVGDVNLENITKSEFIKAAAIYNKDKNLDLEELHDDLTTKISKVTTPEQVVNTPSSANVPSNKKPVYRRRRYNNNNQGGGITLTFIVIIIILVLCFILLKRNKYI